MVSLKGDAILFIIFTIISISVGLKIVRIHL